MRNHLYINYFTALLFILFSCELFAQQRGYVTLSDGRTIAMDSNFYVAAGKNYDCILMQKKRIKNGFMLDFLIIQEDTSFSSIYVASPSDQAFLNGKKLKKGSSYCLRFRKYETFKPYDGFEYGANIDLLMGYDIVSFTYRFADDITIYTCLDCDYKKKRGVACGQCEPSMDTIASICSSFIKSILCDEDANKIATIADTVQMEDIFNKWSYPFYSKMRHRYNHIPQNNKFIPDHLTTSNFAWKRWGAKKGNWATFRKYVYAQLQKPSAYSDFRIMEMRELYTSCGISTYSVKLEKKGDAQTSYSIIVSIRWNDCKIVAVNRMILEK